MIRRIIGDGKVAARQKGNENRNNPTDRECPICFLQYSQINITKCCQANICTECYLQVRPQKEKCCTCPFCNDPKLNVTVAKTMEAEEMQEREAEEQRAIEQTIKARARSRGADDVASDGSADVAAGVPTSCTGGFGSSLEQNETVRRMRARSESMSSEDAAFSGVRDEQLLKQLSLTSEDRHALESEMKQQLAHPLARQIEAEAEERRLANVREYYQTNSGRLREARAVELLRNRASSGSRRGRFSRMSNSDTMLGRDSSRRDWNQIVDAFERGGNGEVQTLDDLVVLEAALILSMEHESRRPGSSSQNAASSSEFDAAQHAREGFPLVQELLSRRSEGNESDSVARGFMGSSARRLGRRSQLLRGGSGRDSATGMLLRGITEDEQMALAIAMSLRESESEQQQGSTEEETESEAVTAPSEVLSGGDLSSPLAEVAEEVHEDVNDETQEEDDNQDTANDQEVQVGDDEVQESANDSGDNDSSGESHGVTGDLESDGPGSDTPNDQTSNSVSEASEERHDGEAYKGDGASTSVVDGSECSEQEA